MRFLILLVLFTCLATGCNRGPVMYQVRGKVTNKDGSVPKAGIALVSFVPTKDSTAEVKRSATGPIAARWHVLHVDPPEW